MIRKDYFLFDKGDGEAEKQIAEIEKTNPHAIIHRIKLERVVPRSV